MNISTQNQYKHSSFIKKNKLLTINRIILFYVRGFCVACITIFNIQSCFATIEDIVSLYETHKNTAGLDFYSQFGQDRYVYQKFFTNKKNGVFVDIGAHDGITFNNTYFFEKNMHWKGICIEPIPEVFEQLQKTRQAICIHGCICSDQNTALFLRIRGDHEMFSGILNNYDPDHLKQVQNALKTGKDSAEMMVVQCYDLTKLLLSHGLTQVDYLSLDTEGGELDILKSIDFNLINIDVIDVENNLGTDRFKDFLQPLGYTRITRLGVDEIYTRSSSNILKIN